MESFTRDQIKNILAQKYRVAYGVYEQLERTGKELIDEGDFEANAIISQRALLRSQYLYGIKVAAEAFGISEEEFMAAVNADRGEEGDKCQN